MARTVIVGAARSGLAAATFLARQGRSVVVTDSRSEPIPSVVSLLSGIDVPGVWGEHPLSLLDQCEEVVLSPGVKPGIPFVQEALRRGIPVIGELELAHRVLRERADGSMVLAITGTNGKSTTTDLLAHILRVSGLPSVACGNLGTPLLEALDGAQAGTRFALECSSYQLETISTFHAEGAVLLNLTPDHLARHGTMENYLVTKLRIFERQAPGDMRMTPAAEPSFDLKAPGHGGSTRFGWGEPLSPGAWCDTSGELWLVQDDGSRHRLLNRNELLIPGDHNVENALASAALAHHGGAGLEGIRTGLHSYPGLAHRIALCGERDGVKVYNDSKATNVDATITALKALPGPLVLLLGGEDKGSSYEPLRHMMEGKLRRLVFLGDAIPQLERDLGDLPHTTLWPFDEAVAAALSSAEPGDQVILSPACASFDQFKNFEQRGEHFEELVKAWVSGQG
jgi:UDP-N-acetylmuramoylalanine--D-glutamate ligase